MPTYQYACTACDHQFETVQSFSDDALTECPQCTGRLRKVFNAVGIVFKGSGFYRTDSREKAPAGSAGGTNTDTGDSGGTGDSGDKGGKGSGATSSDSPAAGGSTKAAPATSSSPTPARTSPGSSTAGSAA